MKLGVELHMGTRVTAVSESGLQVKDKDGQVRHYDAGTVLWTAGVAAPALATAVAKATGAEQDRGGRILVGDDLTIPGHPEIFVVGDVMSLRELPGVAEVAMQSGHYAGRRIRQLATGQAGPASPFRYRDLGSAAYIARGQAVVSGGPLKLSGFPGWVSWLFIHIAFLTGFRNRVGAILTWWVAFTKDARRERVFTARPVGILESIYTPLDHQPDQPRQPDQPGESDQPGQPHESGQPSQAHRP